MPPPDSDPNCGSCRYFTDTRGTYGVCRPLDAGAEPFWAVAFNVGQQTNVRPDEGVGCGGFRPRGSA